MLVNFIYNFISYIIPYIHIYQIRKSRKEPLTCEWVLASPIFERTCEYCKKNCKFWSKKQFKMHFSLAFSKIARIFARIFSQNEFKKRPDDDDDVDDFKLVLSREMI